jgi:hypothetical protein
VKERVSVTIEDGLVMFIPFDFFFIKFMVFNPCSFFPFSYLCKEELRAEISSLMVGSELGIGHDPSQHTAYVKSWVKALKDNPREITEGLNL